MGEEKPTKSGDGNVYEMLWDCRFCGSKKLLGKTHRFCPTCGATQDPEWRYFPSDAERIAVKDHVYVGTDKICSACGNAASGKAEHCGRCGAPLSAAEEVKLQQIRTRGGREHFQTENLQARQDYEQDLQLGRVEPPKVSKRVDKRIIIAAITAVVAIIAVVLVVIFWREQRSVVVSGYHWERTIRIEEYRTSSRSGECNSLPSSAYNISSPRRELVDAGGTTCRQVDNGDGTFREECTDKEPVYKEMCDYRIDSWEYSHTLETNGERDETPYWPQDSLNCENSNRIGCEREANRDEQYVIVLEETESDKTHDCSVDTELWNSVEVGDTYTVNIGKITNAADCGSLT